ncbi:hypothetical protein GGR55DRAFT_279671 [Xylaria sp. FL0064]|nr:hypothetical protein GGR55DRAFT_279671 [Xylaria sp. FL0064]
MSPSSSLSILLHFLDTPRLTSSMASPLCCFQAAWICIFSLFCFFWSVSSLESLKRHGWLGIPEDGDGKRRLHFAFIGALFLLLLLGTSTWDSSHRAREMHTLTRFVLQFEPGLPLLPCRRAR